MMWSRSRGAQHAIPGSATKRRPVKGRGSLGRATGGVRLLAMARTAMARIGSAGPRARARQTRVPPPLQDVVGTTWRAQSRHRWETGP